MIKQKEQHIDLRISNNTNKCGKKNNKQILNIYKKKSATN